MRKHKSVVAILLAVMMIFTFMPAMAFATVTGDAVWGNNYQTATDANGTPATVARTFSDGVTTATATIGTNPVGTVTFIDLADAEISVAATCYASNFAATMNAARLVVKAQTGATPANAKSEFADGDNVGGWTVKFKTDPTSVTNIKEVTTVTVSASLTKASSVTGAAEKINDNVADVKVTVYPDGSNHGYKFYDADSEAVVDSYVSGRPTLAYDGKEHTIKIDTPNGYSVSYQKYSEKEGKFVDAAITYKNAVTTTEEYQAVFTKISGTTPDLDTATWGATKVKEGVFTKAFNLRVRKTGATPVVTWAEGDSKPSSEVVAGTKYYLTSEQAADPSAFLVFSNNMVRDGKAVNESADLDEIKAYFNDRYEVVVTPNPANANQQTWIVKEKAEFTGANAAKAIETLNKAHKDLVANYTIEDRTGLNIDGVDDAIKVVIEGSAVVNDKEDDITFTGVTTKSYKAKKKTKKLAKAKSFQVAATAASGNAVTFTATSSSAKVSIDATGKVTVKKGLKKGAKVKLVVKARTEAGNGYKAVSAEKTYTIKIK